MCQGILPPSLVWGGLALFPRGPQNPPKYRPSATNFKTWHSFVWLVGATFLLSPSVPRTWSIQDQWLWILDRTQGTLKKLSARSNMYLYIVRATCTNTDLDSRYLYLKINNSANCITYWKVYTCYLKIHIWILQRQRSMWSAREILSFRCCTAHD
jgi:hypothetical protein